VSNTNTRRLFKAILPLLALAACSTTSIGAPGSAEDEIFYQCYGQSLVNNSGVSQTFCECLNDRAAEVLNSSDLAKARADYNHLSILESKLKESKAHSYERKASLIVSNCAACGHKKFRNCLPKSGSFGMNRKIKTMLIHLEDAQFDLVKKGAIYQDLVVDVMNLVGETCPAMVRNPIQIWVGKIRESDGVLLEETDRLLLDRRLESTYKTYAERRGMRAVNSSLDMHFESVRAGKLPLGGFLIGMDMLEKRLNAIRHLGKDCSRGGRIDKVYRNILSLELGEPGVLPTGIPRRFESGIDQARLQRVVSEIKLAQKTAQEKQRANGPLRCSWKPEQVNGSRLPEGNGLPSLRSMYEDYAGSYHLQLADENLEIKLWAMSDLPRYKAVGGSGVVGLGRVQDTECAVYVQLQSASESGHATDYQARISFSVAENTRIRKACRKTIAFSNKSGARLNGFATLGNPGEEIPYYLKLVPWSRNATGNCADEVVSLIPAKLSPDTISFLRKVEKEATVYEIPDDYW
jgi:hypothetical protein